MKIQNKQPLNQNLHRRQTFHKQIRRQTLENKFKKIRYEFINQPNYQSKLIERASKTIQMIKNIQYYFYPVQKGIIKIASSSVQNICADMDLIKNDKLVSQINQVWLLIAKWQYDNKDHFDKILRNIINSICPIIYTDIVIDFLLQLLDYLILADKVKIVKQKIKFQQKLILVGIQQKVFMQNTALMCFHCLTNLTGYDYDQYVLPFLSKMSSVCKKHPNYFQIYLNFFLTKNEDIKLKYDLFHDYIQVVNQNRFNLIQNIAKHLDIIQVIYLKQPKINKKYPIFSQLNFKLLQILEQYMRNYHFTIQQSQKQSKQTKSKQIKKILQIFYCLTDLSPSKLQSSQFILRFLTNRLKFSKNQSQLQNLNISLQIFSKLAEQCFNFKFIVENCPQFWPKMMKLIKPFASTSLNQKAFQYIYQGTDFQKQVLVSFLYLLQIIASSQTFIYRLVNQQNLLQSLLKIYFNQGSQLKIYMSYSHKLLLIIKQIQSIFIISLLCGFYKYLVKKSKKQMTLISLVTFFLIVYIKKYHNKQEKQQPKNSRLSCSYIWTLLFKH